MLKKTLPIFLIAMGLVGCQPGSSTQAKGSAAQPIVVTDVVKRQDLIGYAFLDGELVLPASAKASAASPYDTPVESISTRVGKFVGRGTPLIKLKIPGAETAAEMAKVSASSAKSSYEQEKAAISGPVMEAEQILASARAAEREARSIIAQGGTADLEGATQARLDAEAALAVAKQQRAVALQPSREAISASNAALVAAREDAKKGIVRAPITGMVVSLDAKEGMQAKSNQTLVSLVNYDLSRVQTVVPPELKDVLVRGASVIVALDSSSEKPLDAKVVDVSIAPPRDGQKSSGYVATIKFDNPRAIVEPVTKVKRVGIKTGRVEKAIVVPVGAVKAVEGRKVVYVKSGENWNAVNVETGISDGALIEIKSGVSEGSVVRVETTEEPVKR